MIIANFPSGPFDTNAYVVVCPKTRRAVIIDPGVDASEKIIEFLESKQLTPTAIWLTHTHWDHTADVAKLKKQFSLSVYVHPLEAENLRKPGTDKLPMMTHIEPAEPDHFLEDEMELNVGECSFTVIHTPGHSPGGVCFYCPKHKILFSGDTLFHGTIGNISFPTSSPKKMWKSLKRLAKLPPDIVVYPGHGGSTTIGEEKWLPLAKEFFGM